MIMARALIHKNKTCLKKFPLQLITTFIRWFASICLRWNLLFCTRISTISKVLNGHNAFVWGVVCHFRHSAAVKHFVFLCVINRCLLAPNYCVMTYTEKMHWNTSPFQMCWRCEPDCQHINMGHHSVFPPLHPSFCQLVSFPPRVLFPTQRFPHPLVWLTGGPVATYCKRVWVAFPSPQVLHD